MMKDEGASGLNSGSPLVSLKAIMMRDDQHLGPRLMRTDISSLRVLHILNHSLPVRDGYAFRSQAILLAQKRRGWEPIILTSPKHSADVNGHWTEIEHIGGLRYFRTPDIPGSNWPFTTEVRAMTALAGRIRDLVQRENPVLLHAHSPILNAIPALWVGRKIGIPVVYEMRALWEDAAVDHGTYGPYSWKYKLVRSLETWVCRRADSVAVICNGLRDDLVRRGIPHEKLTVIPNGVDIGAFQVRELPPSFPTHWNLTGKKVIGFIGSFFRYEGLDLLVEAFARLIATRSDIALLLVGGGEIEAELKSQIERQHLEQYVVMPGSISRDQIPDIYSLIDILAYPRHSMRLTELVTPLKPLEAMAMGKALVASDVGGHQELIQHGRTGLLFTADSVSALVEVFERLLDDNDLRQTLGRQGQMWVRQERSWDKTTAGYSDIYSTALQKAHL